MLFIELLDIVVLLDCDTTDIEIGQLELEITGSGFDCSKEGRESLLDDAVTDLPFGDPGGILRLGPGLFGGT